MKGEEKPSLNSKIFTKKVNRIVKIKEYKNMNNVQNEAPKETEEENLKSQKTVSKKMGKIVAFIGTLVMVLFLSPAGSLLSDYVYKPKVKEWYKYWEKDKAPAEVIPVGWGRFNSRYFDNGETKQEIKDITLSGPGDRDSYNLGYPQQYCRGSEEMGNRSCTELMTLSYFTFRLRGTTNNSMAVRKISAKIDDIKDFSPEALYYVNPQGTGTNAQIGFDLTDGNINGKNVDAKEVENGSIPETEFISKNYMNLSNGDDVSITASILTPPGKEVFFHIEIFFDGREEPLIVRDGGDPLRVVSYPASTNPADRTYVPVYVEGLGVTELTQCAWPTQCQRLPFTSVKSDEVSSD